MRTKTVPTTAISHSSVDKIVIREADLVKDLIGALTFTEMMLFLLTGKKNSSQAQVRILDSVLVTLMEHGLTPSAIATRLTYFGAPDSLQSAVAAGLLGVGTTFIGTMEGCAALIDEMLVSPEGPQRRAVAIATRHHNEHKPLPGFGHPIHKPDDPRSLRLLTIAREENIPGRHIEALLVLSKAVDEVYGRHLTINATGAVAAVLGEIDIPHKVMRGVAVVSRAAGLVGHILEEQRKPAAAFMWEKIEAEVPYQAD